MGKTRGDKPVAKPRQTEPPRLPGTRGSMKPVRLAALLERWREEGSPEEDRAALQALEEEYRRVRE